MEDEENRILGTYRFRTLGPGDFLFKIQSFSLLSQNGVEKYESNEFQVDGYMWKLILYPKGNKSQNGMNHISLYLEIANSNSLPIGWELQVVFRLFIFDQIRDRYLVRGDVEGGTSRFHDVKRDQGFSKFLSLAEFHDHSNGYLVDDNCVFGAEVYIHNQCITKCESLSMIKLPIVSKYSWKIENFSNIEQQYLFSDVFEAGNQDWRVLIYPKGNSTAKNNSVSIYLNWSGSDKNSDLKVYAGFKFRLRDRINGQHVEHEFNNWFSSASTSLGWHAFIKLDVLNGKSKGLLIDDTCIIETEVKVLGVVSNLP